jgi:hypothetical protein
MKMNENLINASIDIILKFKRKKVSNEYISD